MDFVLTLIVFVLLFGSLVGASLSLRDLVRSLRAGAQTERRDLEARRSEHDRKAYLAERQRGGYASSGLESISASVKLVRLSPGHRNFGIRRASQDGVALPSWRTDAPDAPAFMRSSLADVLQGEHPGLVAKGTTYLAPSGVNRHILGDH